MQVDVVGEDVKSLTEYLGEQGLDFEDQSVLVTGGAGFLGSFLCDVLVKLKANVNCLDNFSSGTRYNIQHLVGLDNFRLIEHDISRPLVFDRKIDVVVHLASRASPFEFAKFPIQIMKANTLGTWVALGIAKHNKSRLVYASSSEIYGDPDSANIPTSETYWGNVNPVGPRSCYDEAKRAGEAFVNAYKIEHGLDTRVVRIFNTYGPKMRPGDLYGRVIPRFINQALSGLSLTVFGDGTQTRSFSYVSDTVKGIIKTMWVEEVTGEVFNLGSSKETSIIDLAKVVLDLTGSRSEIEFYPLPVDDPKRRCPEVTKAKKLLGWEAKESLEKGLLRTIEWFRKQRINP